MMIKMLIVRDDNKDDDDSSKDDRSKGDSSNLSELLLLLYKISEFELLKFKSAFRGCCRTALIVD